MTRFYSILFLYMVTCMAFAKPGIKRIAKETYAMQPFRMNEMRPFFVEEETHDFIHYDTSYWISGTDSFHLRISRPRNMFTANHPDTASRPVIIHMGGLGETGNNEALLRSYGPHYWLYRTSGGSIDSASGWDGGIYTDAGTKKHFPIYISVQYNVSGANTPGNRGYAILNHILNTYHIKRNSVHLMGLSGGAFLWTGLVNYATAGGGGATGGEQGMSLIKSVVALQGQSNLYNSGTIGSGSVFNTGFQGFGRWAKKYGGKFFGLEGTNDDRQVWRVQQNMNDSLAGSAYFAYENFGSGAHCCWNSMYSPYKTDWKSTGSPLGGNITTGGFPPNPNSMGTYIDGDNIFTWAFKQGDTSLVSPMTSEYIVKPAMSEYKIGYLTNTGKVYSFTNNAMQQYGPTDTTMVDVATGFNTIAMLDEFGYVHVTTAGSFTPTSTRVSVDTSGAAFNNNIAVFGCGAVGGGNIRPTFCTIKSDSTVWYWGDNQYNFFGGGRPIKPIQLSPGGMKFKKLAMNYYKIVGLTTSGDVYEWLLNGSTTPTQKTIPRPAIDIAVTYFNAAVCIIPKTSGSQVMGYPYWWGTAFNMWGGNTDYTQPTEQWSLTVPIKAIGAGYHTTHYVDSLGRMYGIGENVMGEIGNNSQTVDKYTYPTQWDWSFTTGENMVSTPTQIGAATTWKNVWGDNTLSFYKIAQDVNDSIYFWGRDKALVSGRGYLIMQEESYPNVIDVIVPTQIHPLAAIYQQYNFTAGTANAGADQPSVTTSSTTLSGSATATIILANGTVNNGQGNISPTIASYQWTKVSGTGGTIVSPTSATTNITGMTTGTYVFRLTVTDSFGATYSDTMTVTVNISAGNYGGFQLRGRRFKF